MNEQFCPHCGKPMENPFGQLFYCKDECDLRLANAAPSRVSDETPSFGSKFQIGDRVRVYQKVTDTPFFNIGDIFYISKIDGDGDPWVAREKEDANNGLCDYFMLARELELCPLETNTRKPGEFKKGDKVRVYKKTDKAGSYYSVNDIFYVADSKIDSDGDIMIATDKETADRGYFHNYVFAGDLELVEAAP